MTLKYFKSLLNLLTLCLQFLTAAVVQMLVWNLCLVFCPQIHVTQGGQGEPLIKHSFTSTTHCLDEALPTEEHFC